MSLGLRVLQRPRDGSPSAANSWSPRRLLIVIVFRGRHCQDRRRACRLDHIANAHRLARTRISDNHMPGPLVPGRTQHRLEPALKGRLDEDVLSEREGGSWLRLLS